MAPSGWKDIMKIKPDDLADDPDKADVFYDMLAEVGVIEQ